MALAIMPIDHFGKSAKIYDRIAKFSACDTMIRLASLPVRGRLLDAGGGTGRVAHALRDLITQIVVSDLSFGMLRRAAMKNILTTCTLLEELPFPDYSFDRIVLMDALHHVCDQQKTALELWRVLAPGGRLVIIEPDIKRLFVKGIAIMEKLLLMRSHFLTVDQMTALFIDLHATLIVENHGYNMWLSIRKKNASDLRIPQS